MTIDSKKFGRKAEVAIILALSGLFGFLCWWQGPSLRSQAQPNIVDADKPAKFVANEPTGYPISRDEPEQARPVYICFANLDQALKLNEFFRGRFGRYALGLGELGLGRFRCPVSRKRYIYQLSKDKQSYVLFCPGHFHKQDKCRPNHPYYSSKSGPELR